MKPGDPIRVLKRDFSGAVSWEYSGRVLFAQEDMLCLEAFFDREDMPFQDTWLKRGDRFIETYYTRRWYNIFEIYDRDDGRLKGWYCNICRPAVIENGTVSFIDLALDLWVTPQGEQKVLDEEEFALLPLDAATRCHALAALQELQLSFRHRARTA
ncbi:MAG: DUF402 domain-containing protein [Anaerolineales bacterium]